MTEKVFAPARGARQVVQARRPGKRAAPVGTVGPVTVQLDPSLAGTGQQLGQAVLAAAENDYQRVAALWGGLDAGPIVVEIDPLSPGSDGTGGAYHMTCDDTLLHADADLNDAERTSALWIAEFVEVLSARQGQGWDCGNTNGEGLSRVIAEWAYPGALEDYSTAAAWLDGSRPDYVNSQQGTDTDPESNGCAVLFLWWLVSLGHELPAIVAAASSNLAVTFAALGEEGNAWERFAAACEERWPAGQPSGVSSDNPWGVSPPPPPPPPTGGGVALSLAADVAAGDYLLVPAQQLRARVKRLSLTADEVAELVQLLGELLALVLGKGGR